MDLLFLKKYFEFFSQPEHFFLALKQVNKENFMLKFFRQIFLNNFTRDNFVQNSISQIKFPD